MEIPRKAVSIIRISAIITRRTKFENEILTRRQRGYIIKYNEYVSVYLRNTQSPHKYPFSFW